MSQNGGLKLQDSRENTRSFRRNLPARVLVAVGSALMLLGHLDSFGLSVLNSIGKPFRAFLTFCLLFFGFRFVVTVCSSELCMEYYLNLVEDYCLDNLEAVISLMFLRLLS